MKKSPKWCPVLILQMNLLSQRNHSVREKCLQKLSPGERVLAPAQLFNGVKADGLSNSTETFIAELPLL